MATTVSLKPNAVEISGSTSGTTTLQATAVAGTTTLTLPAATDTLVGKATTDTLTNKTLTGAAMNGTVGATTPSTGAFTTLSATGVTTVQAGTAAAPAITTTGDTNTGIWFPAADTIAFTEGGVESMRLDSSGNLLVNTTTTGGWNANAKLESVLTGNGSALSGYCTTTSGGGGQALILRVNATTYSLANFYYNGATSVGSITTNGTTTTYGVTSDYRLKTVIGAVTGQGERIDALEPIEYTWNSNGQRTCGFLAHKFQEVYSDSVRGTKDAVDADGKPVYQSMQAATSEVIADLVAEIQSLRKRLAAAGI